ncbi:unnamed protein product [Heterobilharzia americana]|nr:unnamed protein product [Heterobilharzia americana]CAH8481642.1 unnamed protein product [Heterobilharzia americana]
MGDKSEKEKAPASGNTRQLFRLIKDTRKKTMVSETITKKGGTLIPSKDRRLEPLAEYFPAQFNWPTAMLQLPNIQPEPSWEVDFDPLTLPEVKKVVSNLKRC